MDKVRLPEGFVFTAQSLETFRLCPRKFRLRYLDRLKWGDYSSDRGEESLRAGRDFHLLANRYFSGLEPCTALIDNTREYLKDWLEALKRNFPLEEGRVYLPEYRLVINKGRLRLEANLDLLSAGKGKLHIWDWKTHGGRKPLFMNKKDGKRSLPENDYLTGSLQTKVYMAVLGESTKLLKRYEADFEAVTMCYWSPVSPNPAAEVKYGLKRHEQYLNELLSLIDRIRACDFNRVGGPEPFYSCRYCEYCKLCHFETSLSTDERDEDSISGRLTE